MGKEKPLISKATKQKVRAILKNCISYVSKRQKKAAFIFIENNKKICKLVLKSIVILIEVKKKAKTNANQISPNQPHYVQIMC